MASYKEYHNAWGAAAAFEAVKNKKKGTPLLVLVPEDKGRFETAAAELKFFAGNIPVLEFPSYSQEPFEEARPLSRVMAKRSAALYGALHEKDFILLASPYSLLKKVPAKKDFLSTELLLKKGSVFSREELAYFLDVLGYVQVEFVNGPGEYNIRGGLADIFPINAENPLRIEYFDDEIDSLFYYDAESQTRISVQEESLILPASDLLLSTEEFAERLEDEEIKEKALAYGKFAGFHWFAPMAQYAGDSLFDYMPENFSSAALSYDWREDIKNFYQTVLEALAKNSGGKMGVENFISPQEAEIALLSKNMSAISEISGDAQSFPLPYESAGKVFAFEKRNFYQSLSNSMEAVKALLRKKMKIILGMESDKFAAIFREFSRDYDIFPTEINSLEEAGEPGVYFYRRRISGGFVDDKEKTALVSDSDIFGFSRRKPRRKKKEVFGTSLTDLEEGDYVVHVNHGVGIYKGIKHLTIAGVEGDYLAILYEGDDIFYAPLHGISQIQKYVGFQGQTPRLSSLKTSAWAKLKKYAKESAKNVAQDLLRLYAERKAKKGFAFLDDGAMLEDFERAFEYDETEDQLSAILDVYKDMESETPMERLVCGDVGFGKTEVAMRAACKAASCGKQTAVLVPTTVLARQHFETFSRRFADFPITVDFISRFRTGKETRDIFEKTAEGYVDILIGTHKMLSKDLVFKDLGLLIVDEEQRFGVSHKEKIAAIKRDVDTLTLSATPIPRTLQLSLSGIRDMSVIETPPENRLPVVVKVVKGEEGVTKAIKTELERGGQAFFLHNKIKDIHKIAERIKTRLPQARVDFAHGQMEAKTLENILQSFYAGDIDVLISTTIIENGIDIPNVNTIIINNADRFGLAQLYQLKGRVGRSSKRGYCYLCVDNFSSLTPVAQKRLSIIQQLSDLGSGFKIAMSDLQLRGAGNILGAEQSGFVVRVGYELYVSMIEEAVNEMKGEFISLTDTEINSSVPYFIPADFVENPRARFDFYRRFANVSDRDEARELLKELEAGYGELPPEVKSLGLIMLIKNLAGILGAVKVGITGKGAKISFAKETKLDPASIAKAADSLKITYRFSSEYELSLAAEGPDSLGVIAAFFEKTAAFLPKNSQGSENHNEPVF